MADAMEFPETFDEFAISYGFSDTKKMYTNGSRLIPVFRVKQWLEHISSVENKGEWIFDETLDKHYYCSECKSMGVDYWDYCPYCGAKMKGGEE